MATATQVQAATDALKAAIADEKVELKAKLDAQEALILQLKEQIQTGENPALDTTLTDLIAATADIKKFVEPA